MTSKSLRKKKGFYNVVMTCEETKILDFNHQTCTYSLYTQGHANFDFN